MAVDGSKSRSFFRNKYLEYRRQYVDSSKDFSKKLETTKADQPKTAQATDKANEANAGLKSQATEKQTQQAKLGEMKTTTAQKAQMAEMRSQAEKVQTATTQYATLSEKNRTRMQRKLATYKPYIKAAAARYDLPEELIAGVIWQESRANPRAVSHCGAMGLMQLMPGTARHLGVSNAFHPGQNIDGGAKYLRQMLDKFGKVEHAVAAYNAGPGNVQKYGGIPPFRETRDYVPKVLGGAQSFKLAGGFQDEETPTAVRV